MSNPSKVLAKRNCDTLNKTLDDHTKMVANLAHHIVTKLYANEDENFVRNMKEHAILASILHDIGKIDRGFQKYIKSKGTRKTEDKTITHNVTSWYYACKFIRNLDKNDMYHVGAAILNHHPFNENFKENEVLNRINAQIDEYNAFYNRMCEYATQTFNVRLTDKYYPTYNADHDICMDRYGVHRKSTRLYPFDEAYQCANHNILRIVVLTADRTVSSLTSDNELSRIMANDKVFMDGIMDKYTETENIKGDYSTLDPDAFDGIYDKNRIGGQIQCVLNCEKNQTTIVNASAGSGKTLIGVLWHLHSREKTIWVNTRNIINRNSYMSVTEELRKLGETEVKVCQINGNTVQDHNFMDKTQNDGFYIDNADIIIINIDSLLNWNIKNSLEKNLIRICTNRIIFDEFHEMVCEEPLFSAFINLMWTRCYNTKAKTLLLSATPIDLTCFGLGEKHVKTNRDIPVINGDLNIRIKYTEVDDVKEIIGHITEKDSFAKLSTIPNAQDVYGNLGNENAVLLHSQHTAKDRMEKEAQLYRTHGKNSDGKERDTVVATRLLTTGLDVSAQNMTDMAYGTEDTIQSLGRVVRFGERDYGTYNLVRLNNDGFVSKVYDTRLYKLWCEKWKTFVDEKNGNATKKEIYRLMEVFKKEYKDIFEDYWIKSFNKSEEKATQLKCRKYTVNVDGPERLSSTLNYRGESQSIFVIAKNENEKWTEPIVIDKNKIPELEMLKNINGTIEFMTDKYGINEKAIQATKRKCAGKKNILDYLMHFSLQDDKPFPLFEQTATYNRNYGLMLKYKKD